MLETNENTNEGKELSCPHCQKAWTYHGYMKRYATCPDCRRAVKINNF